jgi:tetratricopeptide (TPR) repeat protein
LPQNRLADAIASCRRAVELAPDDADCHMQYAVALRSLGRKAEMEAAVRRAIELAPHRADIQASLGQVLLSQGRYSDAVVAFRRSHELESKTAARTHSSGEWVRKAERLADLAVRLPAVLAGEAHPADAAEQVEFATVCRGTKRYAAAVQLYTAAFAADPALATADRAEHSFDAACCAVLAASEQGVEADTATDDTRERLRRQALDWLTDRLALKVRLAETPVARRGVRQMMLRWQMHPDLAGVRDSAALSRLPAAEQASWQAFWADVAGLAKRCETPAPKP